MKFLKRIHINIFTLLVVAAGLGVLFRAVNIVTFHNSGAPAIMSAAAEEAKKPVEATHDDVQKSVNQTLKDLNETAPPPKGAPGADAKGTADGKAVDTAKDAAKGVADSKAVADTSKADDKKADGEGPDSVKAPSGLPADTSNEDPHNFSASEIEVLQSLAKRRDELDKREKTLASREALLTAGEEEVDRKVAELNKLKASIEKLLGQQQDMEDARINSLVKIYESMKPKEAATIFNTLDMDVLLAVIGRMKEAKSSPLLAAMDPEKARIVTIKLAEQRKLPSIPDPNAKKPGGPSNPPALPADAGAEPATP